ncbi:hypothetical protein EMCRGX_G027387 [Ephydatia muelleri]
MNVQHTFLNYCLGPHGVTVNTLYYVLHKLVLSIADDKECSSLNSQCWYIDDGVLAGHSQSVHGALTILQQQGPSLGLHINLKKYELFGAGDLSQFPISIPSSSIPNFKLLGAPIGDFNFCSAFITRRISNASTLLSHLQKVGSIDPHVAFTLLRSCAGFCKFVYVARTTPPSMATATFEHFDCLIHECFSECTGVNTTTKIKLN